MFCGRNGLRRRTYIIGSVAASMVAISVGLWLYWGWLFEMYPEHAIVRDTGINQFVVVKKVHNDYEWYATVRVQSEDTSKLLQRYPFKMGFTSAVLGGKRFELPVTQCSDCLFYLSSRDKHDQDKHPYDYVLYLLNAARTELTVYEVFGN
jgi:hypothetical protein